MSNSESFTIGFGDSTRNSSRVLNPPGGISSDIFGTNSLAHGPPRTRNVGHLQSSFSLGATGIPDGVYDIFPEKPVRSPVAVGRQARSEVFADRGKAEESTGTAENQGQKVNFEEEVELSDKQDNVKEQLLNDNQGNVKEQGNELGEKEEQQTSGEYGKTQPVPQWISGGPAAHVQLPRAGSRNPITGFGIGVDDTREISSSGGETAGQNHFLGGNTGKRMFNRYNQRSQQW
uniref:Uncharacterized protein n=1 Tax=Cacopsylla melanoneura TaxID=428564 RepID=A0A8D8VSU2_9HEMI